MTENTRYTPTPEEIDAILAHNLKAKVDPEFHEKMKELERIHKANENYYRKKLPRYFHYTENGNIKPRYQAKFRAFINYHNKRRGQ